MHASMWSIGKWGVLAVTMSLVPASSAAQQAPARPARAIPGITTADSFPQACVSCHVVLPSGMDVRLSTLVQQWMEGADSSLLAMAQSVAPPDAVLTGRHPRTSASLRNIPTGCLSCHGESGTSGVPFGKLMHRIHLTGGPQSIYLTAFQGECTYCHKLDLATGAWSIPSGPEP